MPVQNPIQERIDILAQQAREDLDLIAAEENEDQDLETSGRASLADLSERIDCQCREEVIRCSDAAEALALRLGEEVAALTRHYEAQITEMENSYKLRNAHHICDHQVSEKALRSVLAQAKNGLHLQREQEKVARCIIRGVERGKHQIRQSFGRHKCCQHRAGPNSSTPENRLFEVWHTP
ncbi:uncharacterized protein L3040_002470 [Drepanopeziza brunnea f. sp. 'multigermtubi']|uniref:Uncharacterized protein n=1 Tax=Marssonina brunnea f. sp. multigermtubi (strain MB_m1) TaxID=1072389 RepID=K1Y3S4_MARBU|nr:uncharacterized protein MBM_01796 [Drepanopeziza brunnea f. sp. 'multigermtubi' MB_m1]EKD19844.1 hypothetical protein MBM_01796 [Drepanopeziza brunnea f. sp. 'multigermtubi' MB_m1]KAJ5050594.1 hypothetical protein L3040_002470 [Drepanopeziza brunnea f. sp. 'multigermtubi']